MQSTTPERPLLGSAGSRGRLPWVGLVAVGMFFADALWRLPVYLQDVTGHDVGGAGLSLLATLIAAVAFGAIGIGLARYKRWAPVAGVLLLGWTALFILVNFGADPHRWVAGFAVMLAFSGLVNLLWRMRARRSGRA